jgi:anti-anti-sigma factor
MIQQVVGEGECAVDVQHGVASDGVVTVTVSGEIDMATAGELHDALTRAVEAASAPGVVVDMSAVRFCDSSGLNALVAAHREAQQRKTRFRVGSVSEQVRWVLEITSLLAVLTGQPGHDQFSPPDEPIGGPAGR